MGKGAPWMTGRVANGRACPCIMPLQIFHAVLAADLGCTAQMRRNASQCVESPTKYCLLGKVVHKVSWH